MLEYVKLCKLHEDTEHAREIKNRFDEFSLIELDMKVQNEERDGED